jgi:AAA15 family ATPase/GTPase
MLHKFSVKNFKNFKNKFTLDLSKTKNYEFNKNCIHEGTIAKAIIYGANGCGKSNLRLAIMDIRNHFTDAKIPAPYLTHYINANANEKLVEFEYEFKFSGVLVKYIYGKSSVNMLEYEKVLINDDVVIAMDWRNKEESLFVKLIGTESLNTDFSSNTILKANKRISVVKYVLNNAILEKNDINQALISFFDFVDFMDSSQAVNNTEMYSEESFCSIIAEYDSTANFQNYLNKLGVDCKLIIQDINGEDVLSFDFGEHKIPFFEAASTGTISLSHLYLNFLVLKVAQRSEKSFIPFLFIDEYDAYYHYKASILILEMLKEIECQLILTTHNTSIMSNDLFRPDCYFVMEKEEAKPIFLYTAKELRKAHNIEKMFKSGTFF